MKKQVYKINLEYSYQPSHKYTPYNVAGKWMNGGELVEVIIKSVLGLKAEKDGNTSFDAGDDIPEYNASVKSSKATLTSLKLGNDYETVKQEYFRRVHSSVWFWGVIVDDEIVVYEMNKEQFAEFMDKWSNYDEHRKVIRFKTSSVKMLNWMEERI